MGYNSDDDWGFDWRERDSKILKQREIEAQNNDGDSTVLYTVKVPRYLRNRDEVKRYLRGIFHMSCNCSHDCCGHFFSSVWTKSLRNTKRREFTIEVAYRRNV